MGLTLYELADSLRHIAAQVDETGEITPDLEAALDSIEGSFAAKAEALCRWRVNLEREAAAYATEAERLTQRGNTLAKRAAWIKDYLYRCMTAAGTAKLEAGLFKLRVQKNSRPGIFFEGDIPEAFKRTRVEFDSQAAYEAWKAGAVLPENVRVVEGNHLRIS